MPVCVCVYMGRRTDLRSIIWGGMMMREAGVFLDAAGLNKL